jgi:hypothetical protein
VCDEGLEALADQVVAEIHAEGIGAQKGLGDKDGVRQAQRGILLDIGHRHAESDAVAHRGADLLVGVADDDADLFDPGGRQRLDPIASRL